MIRAGIHIEFSTHRVMLHIETMSVTAALAALHAAPVEAGLKPGRGLISTTCFQDPTMKINHNILLLALTAFALTGCASVNMASKEDSDKAKQFSAPSAGNSSLYVYRNSLVGKALKKDIWVDGKCLGESASDVFFYTQVEGGKKHKIETESEFSPNALEVFMETGKNNFVRQFIKIGAFVGGADLEQIPEEQGKADVAKLGLATPGTCGK